MRTLESKIILIHNHIILVIKLVQNHIHPNSIHQKYSPKVVSKSESIQVFKLSSCHAWKYSWIGQKVKAFMDKSATGGMINCQAFDCSSTTHQTSATRASL